jgi:acyl-CoA dehydrogenase
MTTWIWAVAAVGLTWALTFRESNRWTWASSLGGLLLLASIFSSVAPPLIAGLWIVFLSVAVLILVRPLRRLLICDPLFLWFRKAFPRISPTEQDAIRAATVWWEGDLFSGKPNWEKLLSVVRPKLSSEEQAFLDGPLEELCSKVDDWKVSYELNDLPADVWQYIKDKGFMGIIIPKEYSGLGFSAYAHSQVVAKLWTRSPAAAVSVMVPNSLGPADLLLHYGTEAQKRYYLPRLAHGIEIPCFALTGPDAGSDIGAMPDSGNVCYGAHEGRTVLGMRVTWNKRYVTLCPVATLLGLAFRLYDPERYLRRDTDLGITIALIPTTHPGVNVGRRHLPLDASFMNGPSWGKDIFIPMDWVIGGEDRVGQGWRMLMECLAAGRSISLPSASVGVAKLAARTTGAYARIRRQFRVPIGKFEGVEEALARIAGNTYLMDAACTLTAGAVDLGEKPSVLSAIVKYHCTERARMVVNDAMDVHGGKGICLGPSNYIGRAYQQVPISITVEGANILTRSMIIFGQGAIRCHPYALREIEALGSTNASEGKSQFDRLVRSHMSFHFGNLARSLYLGLGGSHFKRVPGSRALRRHYQHLSRLSAGFAYAADLSMLTLRGSLKRKENLSARLGDMMSYLYIASAVLKRFEDEGCQQTDLPLAHWALAECCYRAQEAAYGLFDNFPARIPAHLLKRILFPLGRAFSPPGDDIAQQVARLVMQPSAARDRLTSNMFIPQSPADPVGRLELALGLVEPAEAIEAKVRNTPIQDGPRDNAGRVDEALATRRITADEAEQWWSYERLRKACITVDDFPRDAGRRAAL